MNYRLPNKTETVLDVILSEEIRDREELNNYIDFVVEAWSDGKFRQNEDILDILGLEENQYDLWCFHKLKYSDLSSNQQLASSIDNESNLEEDDLFEMSNLRKRDTGISNVIWVSAKNANHGPRVKVQWGDGVAQSVSVSVHKDNPAVVGGNESKLSKDIVEDVKRWIKLNYEVLMKYWKLEIGTSDMIEGLQKLPSVQNEQTPTPNVVQANPPLATPTNPNTPPDPKKAQQKNIQMGKKATQSMQQLQKVIPNVQRELQKGEVGANTNQFFQQLSSMPKQDWYRSLFKV